MGIRRRARDINLHRSLGAGGTVQALRSVDQGLRPVNLLRAQQHRAAVQIEKNRTALRRDIQGLALLLDRHGLIQGSLIQTAVAVGHVDLDMYEVGDFLRHVGYRHLYAVTIFLEVELLAVRKDGHVKREDDRFLRRAVARLRVEDLIRSVQGDRHDGQIRIFGQQAADRDGLALHGLGKGLLHTCDLRLSSPRVLRQNAVADDGVAVAVNLIVGHAVIDVALNGVDHSVVLIDPMDDADVIGQTVAVIIEDQVAGLGIIAPVPAEAADRIKRFNPVRAAGVIGHVTGGDARIVHAERDEHGAPVAVGDAVPGAVTGVAVSDAVRAYRVVGSALMVAHLSLRDGHEVVRPDAGQRHILEHGVPGVGTFHVGIGVARDDPAVAVKLHIEAAAVGNDLQEAAVLALDKINAVVLGPVVALGLDLLGLLFAADLADVLLLALVFAGRLFADDPLVPVMTQGGNGLAHRLTADRADLLPGALFGAGRLFGNNPLAKGVAQSRDGLAHRLAADRADLLLDTVLGAGRLFGDNPLAQGVTQSRDGFAHRLAAGQAAGLTDAIFGAGRLRRDNPLTPGVIRGRDALGRRLAAVQAAGLTDALFGAGRLFGNNPLAPGVVRGGDGFAHRLAAGQAAGLTEAVLSAGRLHRDNPLAPGVTHGGNGIVRRLAADGADVLYGAVLGAGRLHRDDPLAPGVIQDGDRLDFRLAAFKAYTRIAALLGAGRLRGQNPVAPDVLVGFLHCLVCRKRGCRDHANHKDQHEQQRYRSLSKFFHSCSSCKRGFLPPTQAAGITGFAIGFPSCLFSYLSGADFSVSSFWIAVPVSGRFPSAR